MRTAVQTSVEVQMRERRILQFRSTLDMIVSGGLEDPQFWSAIEEGEILVELFTSYGTAPANRSHLRRLSLLQSYPDSQDCVPQATSRLNISQTSKNKRQ
jgi:hypothetical protein